MRSDKKKTQVARAVRSQRQSGCRDGFVLHGECVAKCWIDLSGGPGDIDLRIRKSSSSDKCTRICPWEAVKKLTSWLTWCLNLALMGLVGLQMLGVDILDHPSASDVRISSHSMFGSDWAFKLLDLIAGEDSGPSWNFQSHLVICELSLRQS